LDSTDLEHLYVLLSFIRMAHYWTEVHPELRILAVANFAITLTE
jgi:hypothetical protein